MFKKIIDEIAEEIIEETSFSRVFFYLPFWWKYKGNVFKTN